MFSETPLSILKRRYFYSNGASYNLAHPTLGSRELFVESEPPSGNVMGALCSLYGRTGGRTDERTDGRTEYVRIRPLKGEIPILVSAPRAEARSAECGVRGAECGVQI